MDIRTRRGLPARLEEVRRRFERSRRTRRPRSRIPDSLWAAAVKMARIYGLHRTARALRVDYYSLKERVGEDSGVTSGMSERGAMAGFLELAPPTQTGAGECTLELEDTGGAKMRIHLKGCQTPDLAALSRSFWNPAT